MSRAGDLSPADVARLHDAIARVLAVAVPVGGAIVLNGRTVDDKESGRDFLRAHGRAGQPCPDCDGGHAIVRAVLAGRGTYFCPGCQAAPPGFSLPTGADGAAAASEDE